MHGHPCFVARASMTAFVAIVGWITPTHPASAQSRPALQYPSGVTLDAAGNIFVADRAAHVVFRIDARTNDITVLAGTGTAGWSGDGGPARAAALRNPEWLEFDAAGNLYVADRGNHVIRKIDRAGIITHVAGTGATGQSGDGGPAATAAMTNPFGLTLDRAGNLYFFDTEVHAIRRIDVRTGIVTTVVGNKARGFSGDGGPGTEAMLFRPHNGTFDRDGALIFGDSFNNRIRRWDPSTGIIETIAGTGERGSSPDGTPARQMTFTFFGGMVVDRNGDLLVTGLDHRIMKFDRRAGVIRVVAGTGVPGYGGDGGPARAAQIATPYGIALAPDGDIVFADVGNARIRRIDAATGMIRTIAGPGAWNTAVRCPASPFRATSYQPERAPNASSSKARGPSALWGELAPGRRPVGFRASRDRDDTRPCLESGNGRPSHQGLPLSVTYWYPAVTTSPLAPPITFGAYRSLDVGSRGSPSTAAHATSVPAVLFDEGQARFDSLDTREAARLAALPMMAIPDARPANGRFPVVIGVGAAAPSSTFAEYLASHGYVVALVQPSTEYDLAPGQRADAHVRDIELALRQLGRLPFADTTRVATWGTGVAATPALLAAAQTRGIDAAVSLDGTTFDAPQRVERAETALRDPGALRVPFLSVVRSWDGRARESRPAFEALRYSARSRVVLGDTGLIQSAVGTYGVAVATLGGESAPLAAVRRAQAIRAEYVRRFLDANLRQDSSASAWLARSPEENGLPRGALTVDRFAPVRPAPTAIEFMAQVRAERAETAMARFNELRRADPEADLFREATINAMGYQLIAANPALAIALFEVNTELYPRSTNTWDSLSEAYETTGDTARAIEFAQKASDVAATDTTLTTDRRQELRRIATDRLQRLRARSAPPANPNAASNGATRTAGPRNSHVMASAGQLGVYMLGGANSGAPRLVDTLWVWTATGWRSISDAGPRSRNLPAAAFDTRRGMLVVYGGSGVGSGTRFGDTWEWDGTRWHEKNVRTPGPRDHHAMVYDEARGNAVMFGGTEAGTLVRGTWTWDGQTWTKADTVSLPPAVVHHAMAYDSRRQRVVMYGGIGTDSQRKSDTWEWDGVRWERIGTAGSPGPRSHHRLAYDEARGVVVMFGGGDSTTADTWTYDGRTWRRRVVAGPAPRWSSAMAYDRARQRVVLFGGGRNARPYGTLGDLWEWDGTRWEQRL